jgi:glycosyltransferase involved in cell wall biosynthesis
LSKAFEFVERNLVRQSIGVLTVCKYLEDIAHNHDPHKTIVRLEDISLLDDNIEKSDSLKKDLNIGGPIVMYVGNLQKYQGIDLLLESFRIVVTKVPDANLIVIGGSESDIQAYRDRSAHLGIEEHVHFIGPRPFADLGLFLNVADVLVSPRITGGNTPMKIYSYLDSGRPVLATRLPTHTQVLDDQISLLVSPDNKAMAEGICYLIRNTDYAKVLSNNAKQRVKEEYSYEAFQGKLMNFYHIVENTIGFPANQEE